MIAAGRLVRCILALLLAATAAAHAEDRSALAAGRQIAEQGVLLGHAACAACHLGNGAGQPEVGIPRLAGLHLAYLDQQLSYFAAGARRNAVMHAYARMLTPAQREQVAAYYATLPVPAPVDPERSRPDRLALGRRIVELGNGDPAMPSCSQCHGADGLGVGDFSPGLAGQSAAYIAGELHQWHDGGRRDPKGAFMQAEAGHLTGPQIEAVAEYLASLPAEGRPAGQTRKDSIP
jgi:cytochrome c553